MVTISLVNTIGLSYNDIKDLTYNDVVLLENVQYVNFHPVLENLPDAINALNDAIKVWQDRTCIRFVPKEPSDEHFVTFYRAAG